MNYRHKHIKPKIKKLKKRRKIYQSLLFWLFLLFLIISFAVLYLVLFYPKFQVSKIEIYGNEKIKSPDIENVALPGINRRIFSAGIFSISSKSIFIVDVESLIRKILIKFPDIEDIEAQKKLPDNITLKITERKPFAVLCQNTDACFFIDKNGIIFEELENIPQNTFIIHQESNDGKIFIGENIIDKKVIDVIYKVQNNLKNNFQIDIKEIFISSLLVFKTSENWQIYFDPASDIDFQITKMSTLLKDEISLNIRKNLKYIYLQYKDRAYYK